jgi:hypothetical protein
VLLTTKDIEWINTQYPELNIDIINNKIEGNISFKIDYKGYRIADTYQIRIDLNQLDVIKAPKVFEVSSKIDNIVKKYNISTDDLHINSDKSFCIFIEGKEKDIFKNIFTWQEFFHNGIEKFLFQMSYYNKEGKLPWGEYAHGRLGYIELYAENGISLDKLLKSFEKNEIISLVLKNRQSDCLCGSGIKMGKCHPLIFKGISKMKKNQVWI